MNRKLKNLISVMVSLMMLFTIVTPFTTYAASEPVTITILGTSDLHGRIYPYEYAIGAEVPASGFAKVLTVVKKVRLENPNTILVDCGDTIQDNMAELFNSAPVHPMVSAMNMIGYDTWTLGNHEFNFGMDLTNRSIKAFKGTVLAGNIYNQDGKRFVSPYKIIEKNGIKIGIIGITNPNIPRYEASNPDNFKGLTFTDPVKETRKIADELKGKVDVMIGVIHMGEFTEFSKSDGITPIIEAVPELTAVIAGHAHSDIAGKMIGKTLVVEPKAYGAKVSRINLSFENKDGKWIVANETSENIDTKDVVADPDMLKAFKAEHEKALSEGNMVIGKVDGNMLDQIEVSPGIATAKIKDTALIDFVNEVQMKYTGADVSAAALFSDTANVVSGDFKKKDVANIYKYTNTLMAVKVTGKQLKNYMEWSARYYNQVTPQAPTISFNPKIPGYNYDMFAGVNYEVDVTQPEGSRIKNLTFKGKALADDATLTLALNNYRYGGLKTEGIISADAKEVVFDSTLKYSDKSTIRDLIVDYVKIKGVITPKADNNWKIVGVTVK